MGDDSEFQRDQRRMVSTALSFVRFSEIAGDYLEFGVYRGGTFVNAWHQATVRDLHDMRFYAFDSFRGLPDPALSGVDAGGEFVQGEFSSDRSSFERNLVRAGVDMSRVQIVEGFYDETLTETRRDELSLKSAALVWIDCDLYSSTARVLDFITPLVADGTVLVFDDWHCFRSRPDRGEQRACGEWLERNRDIRLVQYRDFHWAGRSFIVNRD